MDNLLKTLYLLDSQELSFPPKIQRDLKVPILNDKATVLIGMRRTGKTSIAQQILEELRITGIPKRETLYLNLEDDRLPSPLTASDLGELLDHYYHDKPDLFDKTVHIVLDEIQEVEGWEKVIRRYLDTKQVKMCLTGSSSKMLSTDIATAMRGRALTFEVWPFSFREYCRAKELEELLFEKPHGSKVSAQWLVTLQQFLKNGGFPETLSLPEALRVPVLQEYKDILLYRDLIERHKIKNTGLLDFLLSFMLKNYSGRFSVEKIFRDLKSRQIPVGKNTIHSYLSFIDKAYAAFTISLFTESTRKQNVHPRKIYCIDSGLGAAYSLGISDRMGALFENLVYIDLRRAGYKLHYYLTREGKEVDFVATRPNMKPRLFQVCWDYQREETRKREEASLEEAEKELGIRGEIVTPGNYRTVLSEL